MPNVDVLASGAVHRSCPSGQFYEARMIMKDLSTLL